MKTRSSRMLLSAFLMATSCVLSCGGLGTSTNPNDPNNPNNPQNSDAITQIYGKSTTTLRIEIDYQANAEPYSGSLIAQDVWELFRANATKLFPGKTLDLPTQKSQWEQLNDITGTSFTGQQLLDIAAAHRGLKNSAGQATFYFIFLDGNYNDGKTVRTDVLGVAIGTTGVIGMFKPVIKSASNLPSIQKFVEQSTLIHEFGHAIGLVDNGVKPVAAHKDEPNGAHCSNSKCVMYYANEGAAAAVQFAQKYISTGNEILFDTDCQNDVATRSAQ